MYVAFVFLVCFCIRVHIHNLHLHSHLYPWFTFMICIHDMHLHDLLLHSHVCCIGIHIHNLHLWYVFTCTFINHVLIYMYVHIHICICIYAIIHSTRIWCACTRLHWIFLEKIVTLAPVRMCNGYDAEKRWAYVVCMFPPPPLVLRQNYAWMGWRTKVCIFPPPTPLL